MKNKNIRAILIDPFAEKVSEVSTATGIDSLYNILECTCITITNLNLNRTSIDMILDDEGLLKDPASQRYFKWGIGSQPFAGRALLTSTNAQGDTISLHKSVTPEMVNNMVNWVKPNQKELDACLDWTITSF